MSEAQTGDRIRQLVRAADRMAMDQYGHSPSTLKPDGSWVTPADGAIERFLRRELMALFHGDVGIFGEEQGWSGDRRASYIAILDPIDGTAAFRSRIPVWGISLAVFKQQAKTDLWEPLAGIFSMPAAKHVFLSAHGKSAEWNAAPLSIPSVQSGIRKSDYLGISSDAQHWDLRRYPGKLRSFGVSGYEVILVATGTLQASFLTRFHFYDIAAAAMVLWQAGGGLYRLSGEPVTPTEMVRKTRDQPEASEAPIIACHPAHLEALLEMNFRPL
ncbi:MAG: hypothetical protein OXC18_15355 [Desulfurellaceae bacterium]|nr:hypothetical protein [Desulfurellaceae bacterium]